MVAPHVGSHGGFFISPTLATGTQPQPPPPHTKGMPREELYFTDNKPMRLFMFEVARATGPGRNPIPKGRPDPKAGGRPTQELAEEEEEEGRALAGCVPGNLVAAHGQRG